MPDYQTSIYRGVSVNHDQANQEARHPTVAVSDFEVDNVISIPAASGPYHAECAHILNRFTPTARSPCRRPARHHFAWHRDTRLGGERLGRSPVGRRCWQSIASGRPICCHGTHTQR